MLVRTIRVVVGQEYISMIPPPPIRTKNPGTLVQRESQASWWYATYRLARSRRLLFCFSQLHELNCFENSAQNSMKLGRSGLNLQLRPEPDVYGPNAFVPGRARPRPDPEESQ
jgi:hypothetical protein